MKILKNVAIYLLIILLAVLLIKWANPPEAKDTSLKYNAFKQAIASGGVSDVSVQVNDKYYVYTVTMKDSKIYEVAGPSGDQTLLDQMEKQNINLTFEPPATVPWWVSVLPTLLMFLFIFGLFFYMMQQTQGGGSKVMQFGKSRARLVTDEHKYTFKDVAGADEVKEELEEIVEFLKSPKNLMRLELRFRKGYSFLALPEPEKLCWRKPFPEKPEFRSSASAVPILWKCLLALELQG